MGFIVLEKDIERVDDVEVREEDVGCVEGDGLGVGVVVGGWVVEVGECGRCRF